MNNISANRTNTGKGSTEVSPKNKPDSLPSKDGQPVKTTFITEPDAVLNRESVESDKIRASLNKTVRTQES